MRLRRSRERDRESAQLAVQIASKAHAKALRQGLDLDRWRNSQEAHVAGAERVRGRQGGGEGREGRGTGPAGP